MAKILKCPRCQEKIDVTDLSGGSTVRCEACGTMVRLATGSTGKVPVAPPPLPPPAPSAPPKKERTTKVRAGGAGRQTDLFRKMANARAPGEKGRRGGGRSDRGESKSNTGAIIAAVAAGIVVIGGLAYAALSSKKEHVPARSASGKSEGKDSESPHKRRKKEEPKPVPPASPMAPSDSGVFKPGARALAGVGKDVPDMQCSAGSKQTYEGMVNSGKLSDIVAQDSTWITYVIDGLLSDNEGTAKGSMDVLHQIIVKRKLDARMSDLAKNSIIGGFNMPQSRSDEYSYWAQWWYTKSARDAVAGWAADSGGNTAAADPAAPRVGSVNAATENWEATLRKCQSGGFSNSSTPEYYEFLRIKAMGKSAYPYLIAFIDNEDTTLGTTAVLILKEISGRSDAPGRVTEANKAKLKEDWQSWAKSGP